MLAIAMCSPPLSSLSSLPLSLPLPLPISLSPTSSPNLSLSSSLSPPPSLSSSLSLSPPPPPLSPISLFVSKLTRLRSILHLLLFLSFNWKGCRKWHLLCTAGTKVSSFEYCLLLSPSSSVRYINFFRSKEVNVERFVK
jgi:hypothetical protein